MGSLIHKFFPSILLDSCSDSFEPIITMTTPQDSKRNSVAAQPVSELTADCFVCLTAAVALVAFFTYVIIANFPQCCVFGYDLQLNICPLAGFDCRTCPAYKDTPYSTMIFRHPKREDFQLAEPPVCPSA